MVAWALVPRDPILEVPHTVISMVKEDQLTDSECITKDTFTTTTITTTVDRYMFNGISNMYYTEPWL